MKTTRYHSNRDRHGILKPRVFSLGTDFNNFHLDFGNNCAIYYGNYMILLVDSYTCILFSWVVDFVYKADRHNAGAFHGPQIPRCTEGALYRETINIDNNQGLKSCLDVAYYSQ